MSYNFYGVLFGRNTDGEPCLVLQHEENPDRPHKYHLPQEFNCREGIRGKSVYMNDVMHIMVSKLLFPYTDGITLTSMDEEHYWVGNHPHERRQTRVVASYEHLVPDDYQLPAPARTYFMPLHDIERATAAQEIGFFSLGALRKSNMSHLNSDASAADIAQLMCRKFHEIAVQEPLLKLLAFAYEKPKVADDALEVEHKSWFDSWHRKFEHHTEIMTFLEKGMGADTPEKFLRVMDFMKKSMATFKSSLENEQMALHDSMSEQLRLRMLQLLHSAINQQADRNDLPLRLAFTQLT